MHKRIKSFINIKNNSDFSLENLPYGIFSESENQCHRVGVALGEYVIDLGVLEANGFLNIQQGETYFDQPRLNKFIETGKANWSKIRAELQMLL